MNSRPSVKIAVAALALSLTKQLVRKFHPAKGCEH
jgi:hypothetical protein